MSIKDYLVWLWKISNGMRLRIAHRATCGILHVGVSLLFIWVSKHIIDIATGQTVGSFSNYALLLISCVIMQLLLSASIRRIEELSFIDLNNKLRQRLFNHVMISRWMGREGIHTGDILNRIERDVSSIADLLCRIIPSVLITLVRLTAAFAFLLYLDIRLAAVLFFIMPIALLISKSYVKKMRKLSKDIRNTDSRLQSFLQENIQHRTLISSLERTNEASENLDSLQDGLYNQIKQRTNFSIFSRSMVQLGFASGYTTAFLWGAMGLINGSISFGTVTAFLQLVNQVQRPIVELGNYIPSFIQGYIAIERLDELTSLEIEEQGTPIKLEGKPGVRIENVSFSYTENEQNIIQNFSHDFTPGSLTAIIGETGVGKSTLMRLLLALLLPDNGKVIFYNNEREVSASPLTRCNIVYVPQGNTLLSGSIRDNLLLGKPDATEDELRQALHIAVADFVYDLPLGLDTQCGELGAGFSEGQAQRIAIARGLLRPGGIMLLDEPTSSLDKDTEQLLLSRLAEQANSKTVILVTHKEATVQFCTSSIKLGTA
jgi:ABC-type multidrug transport system fused ATPase/permease subunit